MAQRFYFPREQVFSNLGAIGAGFKLYTYESSDGTTPKATFSNTALSSANANPMIADSTGRFGDIFVGNLADYKAILKDANDNTIWTTSNVDPKTFTLADFDPAPASFWGTTTGTSTAYTLAATPTQTVYSSNSVFYITFHTACGVSPTLTVDSLSTLNLKKRDGAGTKTALEANDVLANYKYSCENDGTDIVVLNPEKPFFDSRNLTGATNALKGISLLPEQITIRNNVSDANNDIDFSAGNAQANDGSLVFRCLALTKRLDTNWTAGNNQGGLFSGAKANSTWYHCFAIYNPTTGAVDFGFDTSVTAANIPAGYTKYYLIESILTNGSGNIIPFTHYINNNQSQITWQIPVVDINTLISSSAQLHTLSTPTGRKVNADIWAVCPDPGSGSYTSYGIITSPQQTDSTPSGTLSNIQTSRGTFYDSTFFTSLVQTNTSSQIRSRFNANLSVYIKIITNGWYK